MAAPKPRHLHPGAALAVAALVAAMLAWALVTRGTTSLWSARPETGFVGKAGRAFYFDEPVER